MQKRKKLSASSIPKDWLTRESYQLLLLKDLKASFGEGLKHNIPLPFNASPAIKTFDSMDKKSLQINNTPTRKDLGWDKII